MAYEPPTIGQSIEHFLSLMGAPAVSTITTLDEYWPDIVGPALAARSRPIEVLDGVLTVGCDDSAWASQIKWMDSSIRTRFAELFDGLVISRIQVRVAPKS
ncbi:MAG: DUF721 domain-containing protein [Acidimicrobiales bacterium]